MDRHGPHHVRLSLSGKGRLCLDAAHE
jgi:hypothetical protein